MIQLSGRRLVDVLLKKIGTWSSSPGQVDPKAKQEPPLRRIRPLTQKPRKCRLLEAVRQVQGRILLRVDGVHVGLGDIFSNNSGKLAEK